MNKINTLFMLLFSAISVSQAQLPTIKSVKGKVIEKTTQTPTTRPTTTTPTQTPTTIENGSVKTINSDGAPEYNPESEIYIAYSIVRDEISSTKNLLQPDSWNRNIEGKNEEAIKYLAKAKGNLSKLKNDPIEARKPYVNTLNTDFENLEAERKSKYESYQVDQQFEKKVDTYYNFAILGWEIQEKDLEPSYKGYYSFKKEFESTRPEKFKETYIQNRMNAIDNFFQIEVYKIVPLLDSQVDNIISAIHSKNSSGDEDYLLNAKGYLTDFENLQPEIVYNRNYLLEDKSGINAVQSKMDKEKVLLEQYIASGKYAAHVEKFRQAMIDAVKLSPKKMSNSNYEAMAIKGVDKGLVLQIAITTDVWLIKKNEFGFPLYKYLSVDLGVKFENTCWLAYGQIRKEYTGGGNYGDEYFNYWGLQEEMNCNALKK